MVVCHTCSTRPQPLLSWWLIFTEDTLLAKCGTPSTTVSSQHVSEKRQNLFGCETLSADWERKGFGWDSAWGFPCLYTWNTTRGLYASHKIMSLIHKIKWSIQWQQNWLQNSCGGSILNPNVTLLSTTASVSSIFVFFPWSPLNRSYTSLATAQHGWRA